MYLSHWVLDLSNLYGNLFESHKKDDQSFGCDSTFRFLETSLLNVNSGKRINYF